MVVFRIPGIKGTIRVQSQRVDRRARKLYQDAVRGDAEAQYQLGGQLQSDDTRGLLPIDNRAALKWLTLAARGGSPGAWCSVAHAYARGLGTPRDPKKAFELVLASALADDPAGIVNLGRYYRDGVSVQKDAAHGVALLEEAVNRGFTFAAYEVAQAYRRGIGCKKSLSVTAHWLRIASLGDHPYAAEELARASTSS